MPIPDPTIPIPSHLGGAYPCGDGNTFMPDVWGYVLVKYGITSMLEVGCGYGYALEWMSKMQVTVTGIDGDPNCIRNSLAPSCVHLHDFTAGPPPEAILPASRHYDLALSLEFLEHVDEKFLWNYMAAFRRCRYALITHAEPGQPGHNHVNCQPDDYWIDRFAEAGFVFDLAETTLLRATDRWKAGWGRRTLMFFRRL